MHVSFDANLRLMTTRFASSNPRGLIRSHLIDLNLNFDRISHQDAVQTCVRLSILSHSRQQLHPKHAVVELHLGSWRWLDRSSSSRNFWDRIRAMGRRHGPLKLLYNTAAACLRVVGSARAPLGESEPAMLVFFKQHASFDVSSFFFYSNIPLRGDD